MRYVQVKEDIQILVGGEPWTDSNGGVMPPWTFARYLENIVLVDPAMGTTYKALKSCDMVGEQFKDAILGTWMPVEDAHWEMLKNAIENPKGGGVSPSILRQFIPFMDAVLNAKGEKPAASNVKAKKPETK